MLHHNLGRLVATAAARVAASAAREKSTWWDFGVWTGVLLAAILVLTGVVYLSRARARANDDPSDGPVFTLQQLREMRDQGEIKAAEFERLRAALIADVRQRYGADDAGGAPGERSADSGNDFA